MQDTNNSVLFLFNRKKTLLLQNKIKKDMYSNADKIEWTLIFVSEFGRKFGLTMKQAFNYLTRYKGIDFIDRHYDYVHTQSFQSMITDISEYCHKKGGGLIWFYTKEWAEFILLNRRNDKKEPVHNYDIVYGPIADDRVGVQLWKYETRSIDLPTLVHNLQHMKGITFQYFFGTDEAIKLLKRIWVYKSKWNWTWQRILPYCWWMRILTLQWSKHSFPY